MLAAGALCTRVSQSGHSARKVICSIFRQDHNRHRKYDEKYDRYDEREDHKRYTDEHRRERHHSKHRHRSHSSDSDARSRGYNALIQRIVITGIETIQGEDMKDTMKSQDIVIMATDTTETSIISHGNTTQKGVEVTDTHIQEAKRHVQGVVMVVRGVVKGGSDARDILMSEVRIQKKEGEMFGKILRQGDIIDGVGKDSQIIAEAKVIATNRDIARRAVNRKGLPIEWLGRADSHHQCMVCGRKQVCGSVDKLG